MSTVFNTYDGPTTEPIQLDVIAPSGAHVGHIGDYESVKFTTSITEADTLEVVLPLGELAALLAPCDGEVLVQYTINDQVFLFMPVQSEARSFPDAPSGGLMTLTCAGGRTFLDGELVSPSLTAAVMDHGSAMAAVDGDLEGVVKRIATAGVGRLNHPIKVLYSQGRGQFVRVVVGWDSPTDILREVMAGTGYYISLQSWVPGRPYPESKPLAPTLFLDIKPFRDTGIYWSAEAGDLVKWELAHRRAKATRVTVGYKDEHTGGHTYMRKAAASHSAVWHRRELYSEFTYPYSEWEDKTKPPNPTRLRTAMDRAAKALLDQNGPSASVTAEVDTAHMWTFSDNTADPKAFNTGDRVTLDIHPFGLYKAVITSVNIETTPDSHTVVPVVSNPDTMSTDVFARVANLANRIHHIERR